MDTRIRREVVLTFRAAPTTGGAPAAANTGTPGNSPTQTANVNAGAQNQRQGQSQGQRQRDASANEARGGGDGMTGGTAQTVQGGDPNGGGRGFGGGGRGGFDPNMTPEERRKRMEERLASMTPEERAAFQERMAQRQAQGGGRGGFGGDNQGQGGPGGSNGGQGNSQRQNGNAPQATGQTTNAQNANRTGRVANTPAMSGTATTIDSLFGALPTIETRGQAWLYDNKQLKPVRLRLGISDGTNIEIIDANPEVKEGAEVVTNVIIDTGATATPGGNNPNNPLLGPQRRGGPGGGPGGGGGGGRGGR